MNDRAISIETHLEHSHLKPHLKTTIEIWMHRHKPETFPPVHFPP